MRVSVSSIADVGCVRPSPRHHLNDRPLIGELPRSVEALLSRPIQTRGVVPATIGHAAESRRSGYCGQSPFGFQGVFSTIHGFEVS